MAKKSLVITVVIAIAVGVLSFYGGIQYQKSKRGNFATRGGQFPGMIGQQGTIRRQGNGNGFRPVSGEITSIDNNTITIKMPDGSSKIVVFSDSTVINKTAEGSPSDLKTGAQVMIIGSESGNGTVSATSISLGGGFFQNIRSDGKAQPTKGQPQ